MKKFISIMAIVAWGFSAHADDGAYAVSKISPDLVKNANAVQRLEDIRFEIVGAKETYETNHYVITILNENADSRADFWEYYDKLQEIEFAEGILYDANGKQIKKVKMKDMEDLSGSGSDLMTDNRIKHHNFYYRSYPYSIEYTVRIRYNHSMWFPSWTPQWSEKFSVEKSQYTVVCPVNYEVRYKAFKYTGQPVVAMEKDKKTTTWFASNLPAITEEVNSPNKHEVMMNIMFAPTEFQMGDFKGDMTSWEGYGKMLYAMKAGRDVLPDNIKQDVHRLADGVSDVRKKISILYEYLQKNTRYVSIQLGIGGWQPFDAAYVGKKGYGDCKALSNYMYSLLKEAGIRSDYTMIRAGDDENYLVSDFPCYQFNHIILFVPLEKDTVWLECTSQTLPAGYLSAFTADRFALAIDETGGKLIHTPKYGLKDNLELRKLHAVLGDDGSLQVDVDTKFKGLEQDEVHELINSLSKDKVKEYLEKELDFPTYDVNKFEYQELKSSSPEVDEKLNLSVSGYGNVTGKRLFINPNVMARSNLKLNKETERKYDIVVHDEFRHIDSVELEIPTGYQAESLPEPVNLQTVFGRYSSSLKVMDNKIFYYRVREQYSGTFPAKDYGDLVNFVDEVFRADHNKVVLVKSNNN